MKRLLTLVALWCAVLCTATESQSQVTTAVAPIYYQRTPVVVPVANGVLSLGGNYYNPVTRRLVTAGTDYSQSWVVMVNFQNATATTTSIPPAIVGGDVIAHGISQDGQSIFGWMDSPTSDPNYDGEGFFAPIGNLGSRTLIGFLSPGVAESRIFDMSANGIAVGDATGGSQGFFWTSATGILSVPNPGTGGTLARAISSTGMLAYGMFSTGGLGTEQAGAWIWGSPYPLPCSSLSVGVGCSPDGFVAAGVDGFNACCWWRASLIPIYETGTTPLNGEGRDAVNSGFVVGVGVFGGNQRGFIWHPGWAQAKTVRDYVIYATGVDIGIDVTEARGISAWGPYLFITGADANGGIAIQVLAKK